MKKKKKKEAKGFDLEKIINRETKFVTEIVIDVAF